MDIVLVGGAIFAMIGGTSYLLAWFFKPKSERELLKSVAFLCYTKFSQGIEVTWDDLQEMYNSETKAAVGTSGCLETPEDHQLVELLCEICAVCPSKNPQLQRLLLNLKRSLPQDWHIFVGRNYIANTGAAFLMVSMFGLLPLLAGKPETQGAKWSIAGFITFCSVISLVAAFIAIRCYLRARRSRRLHELVVLAGQISRDRT